MRVLVVLDTCSDRSLDVVQRIRDVANARRGRLTVEVLEVAVGNVGAARAAGMDAFLARRDSSTLWLATTDADSTVPPNWLARQLAHAARGFDAVVGTISMDGTDDDYPDTVLALARAEYERGVAVDPRSQTVPHALGSHAHRHVHGANLGVRADSYLAAGGFPALAEHEDVALVAALTRTGSRLAWVDDIPVSTSTRRNGRTPAGFAAYLRNLERDIDRAANKATGTLA